MGKTGYDLKEFQIRSRKKKISEKAKDFYEHCRVLDEKGNLNFFREIISPQDRITKIYDKRTKSVKDMLMFGSNNYLNLATHPKVFESITRDVKKYGPGIGGPPVLNGFTKLHRNLEDKLSDIKKSESTLLYSSGYCANFAIPETLNTRGDVFIYDQLSHASLIDGLNKSSGSQQKFLHNSTLDLQRQIDKLDGQYKDLFIGVEGIYSMDGDSSPLDKIVEISKKNNAILVLDDAHGLGTVGQTGKGTAEMYNVEGDIDLTIGTFSKSMAMAGGFISGSKELINYFRYFSRPYFFSATIPTLTVSGVLAGLEILEAEPERISKLKNNVNYAYSLLKHFDVVCVPESGILSILIPTHVDITNLNRELHEKGIFVNTIDYPAVPLDKQRIRISFMTNHKKSDIETLVEIITELIS